MVLTKCRPFNNNWLTENRKDVDFLRSWFKSQYWLWYFFETITAAKQCFGIPYYHNSHRTISIRKPWCTWMFHLLSNLWWLHHLPFLPKDLVPFSYTAYHYQYLSDFLVNMTGNKYKQRKNSKRNFIQWNLPRADKMFSPKCDNLC